MYTLDICGMPFAVVNLPRHEASDYFDHILPNATDDTNALLRLASGSEKRHLVKSFKQEYGRGAVRLHQFDGFCSLVDDNMHSTNMTSSPAASA